MLVNRRGYSNLKSNLFSECVYNPTGRRFDLIMKQPNMRLVPLQNVYVDRRSAVVLLVDISTIQIWFMLSMRGNILQATCLIMMHGLPGK